MPSQDAAREDMDLGRGLATLRAVPSQDETVCQRPEGAGARHPSKKPNMRSGLEGGVTMYQGVATTQRSVPSPNPKELEGVGLGIPGRNLIRGAVWRELVLWTKGWQGREQCQTMPSIS